MVVGCPMLSRCNLDVLQHLFKQYDSSLLVLELETNEVNSVGVWEVREKDKM